MNAQPEPLALIGKLVNQAIDDKGWTKGNAALRMDLSEPTLRLMRNGEPVSARFYGKADQALGFPLGLLAAIRTGPAAEVKRLARDLEPRYRALLGLPPEPGARKASNGS